MTEIRHKKVMKKLLSFGKKNNFNKFLASFAVVFEVVSFHSIKAAYHFKHKCCTVAGMMIIILMFSSFSNLEKPVEVVNFNLQENVDIDNTIVLDIDEEDFDYTEATDNSVSTDEGVVVDDMDVVYTDDEPLFSDIDVSEAVEASDILFDNQHLIKEKNVAEIIESDLSELSVDDWSLILINKMHPVPDDYEFELANISKGMQCDERVLQPLLTMLSEAKQQGASLVVVSPYRDYNRQRVLFNRKINAYMNLGYSYTESYQKTSQAVTVPGASEHQIGIAFDIVGVDYFKLDEGFANSATGQWLLEHSAEYGFVLRYPEGKEDITGIMYEPWHFRYVGVQAAMYMKENDLTLEEFVDLLNMKKIGCE